MQILTIKDKKKEKRKKLRMGEEREETRVAMKKKNKRSWMRTMIVLLILLLFLLTMILFFVLFNPSRQVVANPLAVPSNVRIDEEEGTDINHKRYYVEFDAVQNADYYQLYVFRTVEEVNEAVENGYSGVSPVSSFSSTRYEITQWMDEVGEYYISVQAICRRIPSYSSQPSDVVEHIVYYYLSTPEVELKHSRGVEDRYELTWNVITGASGYEIDILVQDEERSILSEVIETSGTVYELDEETKALMNAEDSTDFVIKVRAVSEEEYTQASDWGETEAHTYKQIETPVIEYEYKIDENSETHKITWDTLKYAEGYRVYIYKDGALVGEMVAGSGSTEAVINNYITSVGVYTASLEAFNSSEYISNATSEAISFTVYGTTPTVTGLEVTRNAGSENITIRWNAAEQSTEYYVYIVGREGQVINYPESTEDYILTSNSYLQVPMTLNPEGYYGVTIIAKRAGDYYHESRSVSEVFEFASLNLATPSIEYNEDSKVLRVYPEAYEGEGVGALTSDNNGFRVEIYSEDGSLVGRTSISKSSTNYTSYDISLKEILDGQPAGVYSIEVYALGGYLIWLDSEAATGEIRNVLPLETPVLMDIEDDGLGLSGTNPKTSWNEVENAIGYRVRVSEEEVIEVISDGQGGYGVYNISGEEAEGYVVEVLDGVITVSGWDTYFVNKGTGVYEISVKALAEEDSVYADSEWSESKPYSLDRELDAPSNLYVYQNTALRNNNVYLRWDRYEADGETPIYDETRQVFTIYVNNHVYENVSIGTCIISDEDYLQFNITDALVPGNENSVYIVANAYDYFDEATSKIVTGIECYHFLGEIEVTVTGSIDQESGERNYTLTFTNSGYANLYEFSYGAAGSISYNFFRSRESGFKISVDLDSDEIPAYGTIEISARISYDAEQDERDTQEGLQINEEYVSGFEWEISYTDDVKLPAISNLSFDQESSTFSWDYDTNAISGVSYFAYEYRFTETSGQAYSGIFEINYSGGHYIGSIEFADAGKIEIAITPISSSINRQNGDAVSGTFDVVTTLSTPQNVVIEEENGTLYVKWDEVPKVQTANSYTVLLFVGGDETGIERIVSNSSGQVKIAVATFGVSLDGQIRLRARVKANAHTPTESGGYYYNESAYGVSNEYIYTPSIAAPEITLNGNELSVIKPDFADSFRIYVANNSGEAGVEITDRITEIEDGERVVVYDISGYFNYETLALGRYYIYVIAEQTEWDAESERSNEVEYNFSGQFSEPEIISVVAEPSRIFVSWNVVSAEVLGGEIVYPSGYEVQVGSTNRIVDRIFTINVNLGGEGSVTTGSWSAEIIDGVVYFTYTSSGTTLFSSGSNYVVDIKALANTEENFAESIQSSMEFVCFSTQIETPEIYFASDLGGELSGADLIQYGDLDLGVSLLISRETNGQAFTIRLENLYDGTISEVRGQSSSASATVGDVEYRVYDLSGVVTSKGIYKVSVKYEANSVKNARESEYSNEIYLYNYSNLASIVGLELQGRASYSSEPVVVTINIPTSQITPQFKGFMLNIKTTEEVARETNITLYMSANSYSSWEDNNGMSTISYNIPISRIAGFGSMWQALAYDFIFGVTVIGYDAETNLIAEYGLPEELIPEGYYDYYNTYQFDRDSDVVESILNTSEKTTNPSNIALNENMGRVEWSSISGNVTYYYIYYKWNLQNNSYTLYYNGGTDGLDVSAGQITYGGVILRNLEPSLWYSTNNNYFAIEGYTADEDVIYGVYIYANAENLQASDVVNDTVSPSAKVPNITNNDILVSINGSQYYLTFPDVFSAYSSELLSGEEKLLKYGVTFNGTTLLIEATNTTFEDGQVVIVLSETLIGDDAEDSEIIINIKEFTVNSIDSGREHEVVQATYFEGQVFTPVFIDASVSNVSVTTFEGNTIYQASWSAHASATLYGLIVTNNGVTPETLKVNGEFVQENIIGETEVSVASLGGITQYYITEFLDGLGISAGDYRLWVYIKTDEANGVQSGENVSTSSYTTFTYYEATNSVRDLTYNFAAESRTKTLSWLNDDYKNEEGQTKAYEKVIYKVSLTTLAGTPVALYEMPDGTLVYEIYFGHQANGDISGYSNTTISGEAYLAGDRVTVDVTEWFEAIEANDYVVSVTACPSASTANQRESEATRINIINNRQLELNERTYLELRVDSYLTVDSDGEVTYQVADGSIVSDVTDYLLVYEGSYLFNTKSFKLLQELPLGSTGFGVIVYKDGREYSSKEFYSINGYFDDVDLSIALDAGVYTFSIYAIGDGGKYYSNSREKTGDIEDLAVYTRHMIEYGTSSIQVERDDYGTITSVRIPHGISEVGARYIIYCYEETGKDSSGNSITSGQAVWNTEVLTTTSDNLVEIYEYLVANASVMTIGNYVFKTEWLASSSDLASNILTSDLGESYGIAYEHTLELTPPELEEAEDGGYVLVSRDVEGYVTDAEIKVRVISPLINSLLKYEVRVYTGETTVYSSYVAYVQVTYEVGASGNYEPTYSIFNSGSYPSDENFSVEGNQLIFDILNAHIREQTAIVGNYYFNVGIVGVIKVGSTFEEVGSVGSGAWTFRDEAESIYVHQDVYATSSDKIQNDDTGTDVYISEVTLNSDADSANFGLLSWRFIDGIYGKADYFELYYNGVTIEIDYVVGQTIYSYNLANYLWSDNDTNSNINDIRLRLVTNDENWLATPWYYVSSSESGTRYSELSGDYALEEGAVYGYELLFEIKLSQGGEISNEEWDSYTHDIEFGYLFNQSYVSDPRLYDSGLNSKIEFVVEVVYSTADITTLDFEAVKGNTGLSGYKYLEISQGNIEAWILSINSSEFNMTFNPALSQSGGANSYSFNLQDVIKYVDSSWLSFGDLTEGYYYINIKLTDFDGPYLDGSLWSECSYVKAPWRVDDVSVIDGRSAGSQTLILNSDTRVTDLEKEAWADDTVKDIYIEARVYKAQGTLPEGYQVIAYYKRTASSEEVEVTFERGTDKITVVSESDEYAIIRLSISDIFLEGGVLSKYSGLISFRVLGLESENAKQSTVNSAEKLDYAESLVNYVRLDMVTVNAYNADNNLAQLSLMWEWDFPLYYEATSGTYAIQPTLRITNYRSADRVSVDTYGQDEFLIVGLTNHENAQTSLLNDSEVEGSYTHTFVANGSPLNLQRSTSNANAVVNYLSYQVLVPEGAEYEYLLNSNIATQDITYIEGYKAPIDVGVENRKINYGHGTEEYIYNNESIEDLSEAFHKVTFSMQTESFVNETIYNGRTVYYSYIQIKTYTKADSVNPINGVNGVILQIAYYADRNVGEELAFIRICDQQGEEIDRISDFDGTVDLENNLITVSVNAIGLKYLFGEGDYARTPATYMFKYVVYVPYEEGEEDPNYNNTQTTIDYIHHVRMDTPIVDDLTIRNNDDEDDRQDIGNHLDGVYIKYTGEAEDFTLEFNLSDVSDNTRAVYIIAKNGGTAASQENWGLLVIKDGAGNLMPGVEQTGDRSYRVVVRPSTFNEAFLNLLTVMPGDIDFYAQSVTVDYLPSQSGYYCEVYREGIFTEAVVQNEAIYVDSYASESVAREVYKELAHVDFEYRFDIRNTENGEWRADSMSVGGVLSNIIDSRSDTYQIGDPYAYVQSYDGTYLETNNLPIAVNFVLEITQSGRLLDSITLDNEIFKGNNIGTNYNLYDMISDAVRQNQGQTITITLYAEVVDYSTYWIDQDRGNEYNVSPPIDLVFYHNVIVESDSIYINDNDLTFNNEETTTENGKRTGLLMPSNIPLNWDINTYNVSGYVDQVVDGYLITLDYVNSSSTNNRTYNSGDTGNSRTQNNLVDNNQAEWLYEVVQSNTATSSQFNFNRWRNETATKDGVWTITIQPYYEVGTYRVLGKLGTYEYHMHLKLSGIRNITTTYQFDQSFLSSYNNAKNNYSNMSTSLTNMMNREPTYNNSGSNAVLTTINNDAFGSGYSSLNRAETIASNSYIDGYTIRIGSYSETFYEDFSPANFIRSINEMALDRHLIGGVYTITYQLLSNEYTMDSDRSNSYSLQYVRCYTISGTYGIGSFDMEQSGDAMEVSTPSALTAYYSRGVDSITAHLMQGTYQNYSSYSSYSSTYRGSVSPTSSTSIIGRFNTANLDALTITNTNVNGSRLANYSVYYNSGSRGYLQLGNNDFYIDVDGDSYNCYYGMEYSVDFYLNSSYLPYFNDATQEEEQFAQTVTVSYGSAYKPHVFTYSSPTSYTVSGSSMLFADENSSSSNSISVTASIRASNYKSYLTKVETRGNRLYNYNVTTTNNVIKISGKSGSGSSATVTASWKNNPVDYNKNTLSFTLTARSPFASSALGNYGIENVSKTYNLEAKETPPDHSWTRTVASVSAHSSQRVSINNGIGLKGFDYYWSASATISSPYGASCLADMSGRYPITESICIDMLLGIYIKNDYTKDFSKKYTNSGSSLNNKNANHNKLGTFSAGSPSYITAVKITVTTGTAMSIISSLDVHNVS